MTVHVLLRESPTGPAGQLQAGFRFASSTVVPKALATGNTSIELDFLEAELASFTTRSVVLEP